jgi:hypothetical protein
MDPADRPGGDVRPGRRAEVHPAQGKLVTRLPWVEDFSPGTVRLIGIVELLGAIGLVLPAALDIVPVLTPLAATGLAIVMALAVNTHRRRHEPSGMALTATLLAAALVVAWGRFGPYSF